MSAAGARSRRLAASALVALALAPLALALACTTGGSGHPIDAGLASSGGGTGPGPCSVECAETVCASATIPPSSTCEACLARNVTGGAACWTPVTLACEADPDCHAEQRCVAYCLDPDAGTADAGTETQVCVASGSTQDCSNCCARAHSAGYRTFFDALVACGCGR